MRNELAKNPEILCNEDIRLIAENFFKQQASISLLFSNSSNQVANTFKHYQEDNVAYDKWIFLAESYKRLPTHDNALAILIRKYFISAFNLDEDHFKRMVTLHMATFAHLLMNIVDDHFRYKKAFQNVKEDELDLHLPSPNKLSNALIQQIGNHYLLKHGETPSIVSCFFRLHTNQASAIKLKNCKETTCEKRWLFLAKIYAELPKNRGELANYIRTLFLNAYGSLASDLEHIGFFDSTEKVAKILETIVKNKYTKLQLPNVNPAKFFNDAVDSTVNYGAKLVLNRIFS